MKIVGLCFFVLFSSLSYAVTEQRGQTFVYIQNGSVADVLEHNTLYDYTRCFASVDFFLGGVRVSPSSGTVTITVKTRNTDEFIDIIDNIILANSITVPNWSGNTIAVRSTPASIVGATDYRLTVTCNRY